MANIQRIFLPRRTVQRHSGIEIAYVWEPAEEVGGDYLFTNRYERMVSIEIGDVMGHGLDAALAMTALNGVFFGLRESGLPPQQMVSTANRFMCKLASVDKMVTTSMFVVHIDFISGLVTYTNAGHPYPLYFSAAKNDEPSVLALTSGGTLLGVSDEMTFTSGQLRARPNDFIIMFTDGLPEATNLEGQLFGDLNDIPYIAKSFGALSAQEMVEHLNALLDEFRQGSQLTDDLTMVAIKFTDRFRPEESSR
jgi:phosphoserine phosphatase RsbU/P